MIRDGKDLPSVSSSKALVDAVRTYRIDEADIAAVTVTATSSGAVSGLKQGDALRKYKSMRFRRMRTEGSTCVNADQIVGW